MRLWNYSVLLRKGLGKEQGSAHGRSMSFKSKMLYRESIIVTNTSRRKEGCVCVGGVLGRMVGNTRVSAIEGIVLVFTIN